MMKPFIPLLGMVLLTGCVHTVSRPAVNAEERQDILTSLHEVCLENTCQLRECWTEKPNVIFCRVVFSFVTEVSQEKIMIHVAEKHKSKNYQIGFCGSDSIGTHLVGAFFSGVASGLASAVVGESLHSSPSNISVHTSSTDTGAKYSRIDHINLSETCAEGRTKVVEEQPSKPHG